MPVDPASAKAPTGRDAPTRQSHVADEVTLLALALPGRFYAHYFQLLLPPFCLGVGWATGLAASLPWPPARKVAPILAGLLLAGVCIHQFSTYRSRPAEAVAGKYQELYLRTEAMAQRLGAAMSDDEVLYQWGEESGLYWHGGKRPTAAVLTFPLLSSPQAGRLTNDTLRFLQERPPDLVIAVNYMLNRGPGHPVFEWIRANYTPAEPALREEREFFTFYLPASAEPDFVRRVLGADTAAVPGTAASN